MGWCGKTWAGWKKLCSCILDSLQRSNSMQWQTRAICTSPFSRWTEQEHEWPLWIKTNTKHMKWEGQFIVQNYPDRQWDLWVIQRDHKLFRDVQHLSFGRILFQLMNFHPSWLLCQSCYDPSRKARQLRITKYKTSIKPECFFFYCNRCN